MYHPFSIAETFKTAWNVTQKNFLTIVIYSAIVTVVLGLVQFFNAFVDVSSDQFTEFLVFLILMIIQTYATLGLYKLIFTLIDNEYYEFEFTQLVPTIKMVFSFIAICLFLAFAIVTLNLAVEQSLQNHEQVMQAVKVLEVMLILYAALRYMFCACFIVDDNSGPIESLLQSQRLTKSHMLHLLGLLGIMVLVVALGFMIVGKVVLILYPFVNVVLIVTYRKLVYSNLDVDDDVAETH